MNLKNTKIWIGDNPSYQIAIQKLLFNLGYGWGYNGKKINNTKFAALYISGNGSMSKTMINDRESYFNSCSHKEILLTDILKGGIDWQKL